jgi:tetratricopeptide (TPR) repeat protein
VEEIMNWLQSFEMALKQKDYDNCHALLQNKEESSSAGGKELGNWATLVADYFAEIGQTNKAKQDYVEAIMAYDQALFLDAQNTILLEEKGAVLLKLAETQHRLSQTKESQKSGQQAIAICDQILIKALVRKGDALQSIAALQVRSESKLDILQRYQSALDHYYQALRLNPQDALVLNNQGSALTKMGDLQLQLNQLQESMHCYQDAIAAYSLSLTIEPENVSVLNNKGTVVRNLGSVQAQLAQPSHALQSYQKAIRLFNQALSQTPTYLLALQNKGLTLIALGDLHAHQLAQKREATVILKAALAVFNRALEIAPEHERIRIFRDVLKLRLGKDD